MKPKINSGDLVTVSPDYTSLEEDDIVLCKVSGNHYLHLIKAMKTDKDKKQYLIGNNHGHINGWITENSIFGKVIKISGEK